MKRLRLGIVVAAMALISPRVWSVPQWIWSTPNAKPQDEVLFRKEFQIEGSVRRASLRVAADNAAKVWINGEPVLENTEWSKPSQVDVAKSLRPGANEIRVLARNEGSAAGLLVVLQVTGENRRRTLLESGADWQASDPKSEAFAPVAVLGAVGVAPWGDVLAAAAASDSAGEVRTGDALKTLPGFKAELIYTVPKAVEGSWVSLTVDSEGRLICGDQYGSLYRLTPPPLGGKASDTKVEKLTTAVGGAHGLLWAFDSLYVMVNERATPQSVAGLWRLRDQDKDGVFEREELLRRFDGGGEHGPHAVVLSPDGKSLFLCSGNHTKPPQPLEKSRAPIAWREDHLLPRMWDANGHAAGILAPGGYVVKIDPDGKEVEMFCYGFRNSYDIAFNSEGELFTFDSDMEWDMGAPWYRATRIVHCVSGGDYGWRSGSGLWPIYYPDSLPPTYDIGPGSPTGVVFGTGAKFPAKYQAAYYANDWTYGTMYAVHLEPDGATYKAEVEEFVSGKPLPLSDLVINPKDGAMYFATGGRKTQSALYRVTYVGADSHEALVDPTARAAAPNPELKLRRELEALHEMPAHTSVVPKAWPHLANADRFVRWAARVAIERQPVEGWTDRLRTEKDSNAIIEGCVALARVSGKDAATQTMILRKLATLQEAKPTPDQVLGCFRAMQLTFTRQGKPAPDVAAYVTTVLDGLFPSGDDAIDRELCQLLIFLESPRVVAKTLQLMAVARERDGDEKATADLLARNEQYARAVRTVGEARPNRQQMALAWWLRTAKVGWTPELRRQYFAWFPTTKKWKGGNSFQGFIENARKEALANVPEPERAALGALSTRVPEPAVVTFTPAKGPGRPYTVEEVLRFADGKNHGRDFAAGKNLYTAAACQACHRFGGDGGGLGPDLTGVGNRYGLRDLLENIIEPSKVISDQYNSSQIDLKDGSLVVGRIMKEENGKLLVAVNPLAPTELTEIPVENVKQSKPYPISMMPPGLLNQLNESEVLDLLAYLQSGGNPEDKVFQK
jgi:putative heme-binding domain-containing protein